MIRGTFANIRLRNQLAPGTEGGVTRHLPDGEQMSIYDAAQRYQADGVPLVILAGKEYGSGSSRDWAAKGTALLGVRAVLAESFERIHRSNLVGMGILPLQYQDGDTAESLGLTGEEVFDITGLEGLADDARLPDALQVTADGREFSVVLRIDTPKEEEYFRHGGILLYVLRQLRAEAERAAGRRSSRRRGTRRSAGRGVQTSLRVQVGGDHGLEGFQHGPGRGAGPPPPAQHHADPAPGEVRHADPGEPAQGLDGAGGRKDGGPVPLQGERGDQSHPIELGSRLQDDTHGPAGLVDLVPERRPGGGQEKPEAVQIPEGNLTAVREGVIARNHQHQILIEQRAFDEIGAALRQIDDGRVERTGRQVRFQRGRCTLADHQANLRVGPAHPVDQEGGQPAGRGADHADPGRSGDLVAQGGHVGHGRLQLGRHPPAPLHHGLAFLGQLAAVPIDELDAQFPFEAGHMTGDVGLHGLEGGGRSRETAVVGDGDERLQLPKVHQHKRYHRYSGTLRQIRSSESCLHPVAGRTPAGKR